MGAPHDFVDIAKSHHEGNFIRELFSLMKHRKKYWLMPIVVVLLGFGLLVFLSGTAAAPFIYTLF
jgi:hypothetical protein